MATENELTAAGFVLPNGDEEVKHGDDAIRANASAAYDHANSAATLKAANAIALTRMAPRGDGTAVDGYGTEVGLLAGGSPAAWFGSYLSRLIHVGDSAPESPTVDGFPVLWVDTRDKAAWKPLPAVIDDDTKKITIPDDEGATYTLNGVPTDPGVYYLPNSGEPVEYVIAARAKEGYALTGVITWRGFITAGWELKGRDTLTTGVWETGRAAFGSTYTVTVTDPGQVITTSGLVSPVHAKATSGRVKFTTRRIAQRLTINYDFGARPAAHSIYLGLGVKSDRYGEGHTSGVSLLYSAGKYAASFQKVGANQFAQLEDTGLTIPAKGKFTLEGMGQTVKAYINDELLGVWELVQDTVTAHALDVRLTGPNATASNLIYEEK